MESAHWREIIKEARQLEQTKRYNESIEKYYAAFQQYPNIKENFEREFRITFTKLIEVMSKSENETDVFRHFEKANEVFPGNVHLLNEIGEYFLKYMNALPFAMLHFKKAHNIDSSLVCIERNLNYSLTALFPKRCYKALNDKRKNEAYRAAIRELIIPKVDVVVCLNAGPGLLALYANECMPKSVTTYDSSIFMEKIANEVMKVNSANKVIVANNPCYSETPVGMRDKWNLVIIDTFDHCMCNNSVLMSLLHAWNNMDSEARVIPYKGELFVIGVSSAQLERKHRLCESIKIYLNIQMCNVELCQVNHLEEDLKYYTDLEYVTEPVSVLKINFNNYNDIMKYNSVVAPSGHAQLKIKENHKITSIIGFFNLHLSDNVVITTDPRSEQRISCWDQALIVNTITEIVPEHNIVHVNFGTYNVGSDMKISSSILTFLNDTPFINVILNAVSTACIYLGQTVSISEIDILDFSPFPIFGLEMLKRGARSLHCWAMSRYDESFLRNVFEANGIPAEKVKIIRVFNKQLQRNMLLTAEFHVIFFSVLDTSGDISVNRRSIVNTLQEAHIGHGSLFLPNRITLIGQLVYTKHLNNENGLSDKNVGFKLANSIKQYRVSHMTNLNLDRIEYKALSDPVVVSHNCNHMNSVVVQVNVTNDGVCNAILCWYVFYIIDGSDAISTYRSESHVKNEAFIVKPGATVFRGDVVNIIRCVDTDGAFKLDLDAEV